MQEMLAEKACARFNKQKIDIDIFREFLQEAIYIPDLNKNFLLETYERYLRKINAAGEKLTDKMEGAEEERRKS
jgi:hypothetical protein